MPLFAELSPEIFLIPVVIFAISACMTMCAWVVSRWWQRQPVIPYQPRRPVPWQAVDLAMVMLIYLAAVSGVIELAAVVLGPEAVRPPVMYNAAQSGTEHVVGQLIAEGNVWVMLLCLFSAAVVAPVAEEFFFRVLLQGWLESLQHRWRREMPTLRRLIPMGVGPIVLTSLLFARLHFRVDTPQINARFLVFMLAGDGVARLLTMGLAIGILRWRVGATAADLGWAPRKLLGDIVLGLGAFAAVAAPIYALQAVLKTYCLPECIAPDPFPLFLLALVLGTIYYRTHRIAPLIVLHAALNATSLMLAWLGS